MNAPRYFFAGHRQGWNLEGLTRVDLPPNAGGYRYTEFRRAVDGKVQAVVLTSLLAMP
jgi:hypothetical protein